MQFKITVMSDDVPTSLTVDVFQMASGGHYQDLGREIADIVNLRGGLVTVEIERVA